MNEQAPRVFISYAWSSPSHQERVEELASRLTSDHVHVVLDIWDLKDGHDKFAFMEKLVTDPTIRRVLVICDQKYADKADARAGGVGTESQIISQEVYTKVEQEKFVPILFERNPDGEPCLPTYLKSRIYLDFSNAEGTVDVYDRLLRNIHDRPAKQRPPLGSRPAFLDEDSPISPQTKFQLDTFVRAAESGQPQMVGQFRRFMDGMRSALDGVAIVEEPGGEIDEAIFSRITTLKPLRDQFVTAVETLCAFSDDRRAYSEIQKFFERASELMDRPATLTAWSDAWFDHYRFFLRELFIYSIAVLLRQGRYRECNILLDAEYFPSGGEDEGVENCAIFHRPLPSFKYRNDRLKLLRISLTADLLKERADRKDYNLEALIEAELVITVKLLIAKRTFGSRTWFPSLLVFREHFWKPVGLFARLTSVRGLEAIQNLFGCGSVGEFKNAFDSAYTKHDLERWRMDAWPIEWYKVTGLDKIGNTVGR